MKSGITSLAPVRTLSEFQERYNLDEKTMKKLYELKDVSVEYFRHRNRYDEKELNQRDVRVRYICETTKLKVFALFEKETPEIKSRVTGAILTETDIWKYFEVIRKPWEKITSWEEAERIYCLKKDDYNNLARCLRTTFNTFDDFLNKTTLEVFLDPKEDFVPRSNLCQWAYDIWSHERNLRQAAMHITMRQQERRISKVRSNPPPEERHISKVRSNPPPVLKSGLFATFRRTLLLLGLKDGGEVRNQGPAI